MPRATWKEIFLRLDLEDFLLHIDMNPDFSAFYEKLEVCKASKINTLLVPIIQINNIKSGYYYLTALLTKLPTIKYLEFSGLPQMHNMINEKAAKAIKKGLINFKEGGGKLDMLKFQNVTVNKDLSDCLFVYLSETDQLRSLEFNKTNLLLYGNSMKILSNSLINIKNLERLVFDQCQLNEDKCKVLADSLMRTKKLRIFEIHDNSATNKGLSSIIYNLAFSPNLLYLDISRTNSLINETVVSLYKLLKISASIEVIRASTIGSLNQNLVKDFWVSLGECASLRVLDLSYSGPLASKYKEIGNSVAFNAKKKGSLEYLNVTSCLNGANAIVELYKGMCIS